MNKYFFLILVLMAAGCGGKDEEVVAPGKATLVFPAQNAACTSGTVVADSLSTIQFSWNGSDNTDSYELVIKNLLTQASVTKAVATNQAVVNLLRGTPYSWFIRSISTSSTVVTVSDTWKFYNAGPGSTAYSPFPATLRAPAFGAAVTATGGKIKLEWEGSDVDNDIAGYDVYLGNTATPPLFKSDITDMFLNDVAVNVNTNYYWRIVTHDAKGNTADSGVFQFHVN
ncbi:hypothetical protein F0L74_07635 [Chitinophaga agrisoli]|uniref:Fibronectin type-III domain-containing protein n=1 Tax=Chitinophaga agrisoli TaxID=2607653 RepID=A0A5B2VWH0_9BACT|nr:hypothetical protein [Chitinophaga agrisoli]KAA2242409.1 hypothetical protein F0L74_07635 [Chitinophaga agrisoli]